MSPPKGSAAAAAKGEAKGEGKTVSFKGETFTLPATLPFAFAAYVQEGELLNALRGLLEPADVERFMQTRPSMDEFAEFLGELEKAYGLTPGG